VGNADKPRLADIVTELLAEAPRHGARVEVSPISGVRAIEAPQSWPSPPGRSRAFLKVQDGCQHRCAFCIVPRARGLSRSLDPKVVVDQATRLVEMGHPEIVLTGVDLGHYGADLLPRTTLAALVRALADISGLT